LFGSDASWGKTDSEMLIKANGFLEIGASQPIVSDLDRCLGRGSTVLVALPFKFPLARLFGPRYDRYVWFLPVPEETVISEVNMRSIGADALVIDDVYRDRFVIVPDGLYTVSSGQYTLIRFPSSLAGCG
jgi:hypothetical protein